MSDETDNKGIENKIDEVIRIENKAPSEIDCLSIDVEGAEQRVLGDFNFKKYRFKCMTIERPTELLRAIFKENGYILIKNIPGLDCFYLHESISEQYLANLFAFYYRNRLTLRWR